MHLGRNPVKFDMAPTITTGGKTWTPKPDIRVQGIQIDTKLQ